MNTKPLGKTDINLTTIGLGTWAIGGSWQYGWGPQEVKDSIECIHEAIDAGINWIDTAPVYGWGTSEVVVGKALQQIKSKNILIATKCGLVKDKDENKVSCIKRDSIFSEVEASLKNLQRECIDIYQIHWPNPACDIEEAFEACLELKRQGKIRYAGVSNFSREQLQRISKKEFPVSLQSPYSLLSRGVEIDILPWCKENNVAFLAYSPLQTGILTGKVSREWLNNLAPDDFRKNHSKFYKEPLFTQILEFLEKIKQSEQLRDKTLSHIALSWALSNDAVTALIVGARKKGQIIESIEAISKPLSEEDIREVEKLSLEVFGRYL